MSTFRNLIMEERKMIVSLRDAGLNISEIATELGMSRNTVRLWIKRFDNEGTLDTQTRPRPKIIDHERLHKIVTTCEQLPFTSTKTFAAEYECTGHTVRNSLRSVGIRGTKPARRIVLTDALKQERLRFARDYRDFDFSRAIFSDAKCFKTSQEGRRHLWRVYNTRCESKHMDPNESSKVVVNMWGWMSAAGPGELVYIPGRANGASYLEVLQESFLPTVRIVYPEAEVPELLFIQDTWPIHSSRSMQNWIRQQPIRLVTWPSRSPDLNPFENLWAIMVQRWDKTLVRTSDAFAAHLDNVWESFRGTELCEGLIKSMRKRCDAIIDAGGALTKY